MVLAPFLQNFENLTEFRQFGQLWRGQLIVFFKDAAKQTSKHFTFQENFLRFFEQFRSHFWKTWSIFKAPALFRGTGKFFSVVKFE